MTFRNVPPLIQAIECERKILEKVSEGNSFSFSQFQVRVAPSVSLHSVHTTSAPRVNSVAPPSGTTRRPVLVLVHGYGSGSAFYAPLLPKLWASLAATAPRAGRRHRSALGDITDAYLVDWPAAGCSSRFTVPVDRRAVEDLWVGALDEWRAQTIGADVPIVLAGHSLGGYLASVYATRRPDTVERLVLFSPAGVGAAPAAGEERRFDTSSFGFRVFAHAWNSNLTPNRLFRTPWGRSWARKYVERRFPTLDPRLVSPFAGYFFGIQAAGTPTTSSESFLSLFLAPGAYARLPLVDRLPNETPAGKTFPPVHLLYGEHDWMDASAGVTLASKLVAAGIPATVDIVPAAGHYLFTENPAGTAAALVGRLAMPARLTSP